MKYLQAGISIAVLLAAVWLGYKLGSWRLDGVRNELSTIQKTAEAAKAQQEDARKQLEAQMKQLGTEHEQKVAEMQRGFDTDKADLQSSLQQANDRVAALTSRQQALDAESAKLTKQLQSNPNGPQVAALKKRIDELTAQSHQVAQQSAGVQCLGQRVPGEEIATLNRGLMHP